MAAITTLPIELFDIVIEHLVLAIGIQKAVLLRTTSKIFDKAILRAICLRQVVDINDPSTPCLEYRLERRIKGKIVATKSQFPVAETDSYLTVIVNLRHEAVASAVNFTKSPVDSKLDQLNLLSGAAVAGALHVVRTLIETGYLDVNTRTPFFPGALTLAASRGDSDMVRYLLQNGARLDSVCGAWSKLPELRTQADWNNRDEVERCCALQQGPPSALRAAVSGGHKDVVDLLLQPQNRLPLNNLEYLRAIVVGSGTACVEIIEALFHTIDKKISDFDGLGNEMLWEASRYNRQSVVEMLIDHGIDINAFPSYIRPFSSALQRAASFGHADMVHFLLSRGADVQLRGLGRSVHLPIEGAAHKGQAETVEKLLAHGADASRALCSAAAGSQIRVIRRLLKRFPDLPHRESGSIGYEAFFAAWAARNLTAMTMLVEAGVPLNYGWDCDTGGSLWDSPMKMSKRHGLKWVVKHLRSLGAEDTDDDLNSHECEVDIRGIRVSERTWEWVGKY